MQQRSRHFPLAGLAVGFSMLLPATRNFYTRACPWRSLDAPNDQANTERHQAT